MAQYDKFSPIHMVRKLIVLTLQISRFLFTNLIAPVVIWIALTLLPIIIYVRANPDWGPEYPSQGLAFVFVLFCSLSVTGLIALPITIAITLYLKGVFKAP